MNMQLKQLTKREKRELRRKMLGYGNGIGLANSIGIGRATLYNAVDTQKELGELALIKIRTYLQSQSKKVA